MIRNTEISKAQRADLCRRRYMAELARGGSHIASTLTPAGERAAIADITADFNRRYGTDDLAIFLELLAQVLDSRLRPDTATIVRHQSADAQREFRNRNN